MIGVASSFLLGATMALAPAPEPASFVLVVANNAPSPAAKSLRPLRYADDDGARYFELFGIMAEQVNLLSVLDADTQALYPAAARASRPPSRKHLMASLAGLFEAIRTAKKKGQTTKLFFIFVGHGSVSDSGEGVMHLIDGEFSRSDLFQHVIAKSPADYNHVIVDACNAFLFVGGRGEDSAAAIDNAVDQFLARERMAQYPNTGFVLSTSAAEEVHEWSGFQAGVFSHEVRSALLGGADAGGDGVVTYGELRAFLQAANGMVRDPRAKLRPWVAAPPILAQAPLFDRSWVSSEVASVHVPRDLSGRWSLEDERGVRVADIHSAPDGPVTLLLPTSRSHLLRRGDEEFKIGTPRGSEVVNVARLAAEATSRQARSGVVESYRRNLFGIPFGLAFLQGFGLANLPRTDLSAAAKRSPPDHTARHWASGILIAAGVGAVAAGLVLGELAQQSAEEYRTGIGRPGDVARLRQEARDRETAANILLGGGAALAIGGAVLLTF